MEIWVEFFCFLCVQRENTETYVKDFVFAHDYGDLFKHLKLQCDNVGTSVDSNSNSRLIDFLTKWQTTEMPDTMEIAFMVERSIEDEIQKVAETSSGVIVLSYGIMLLYVALALGRVSSWRRLLVRILGQ